MGLATVGVLLALAATLFCLLMGPQIADQFNKLAEQFPEQIARLQEELRGTQLGDMMMGTAGEDGDAGWMGEQARGLLLSAGYTIIDVATTLILILFVGIFFAVDPGLYRRGITLLVPERRESRVDEALAASGNALWQWLVGQIVAMIFIGVAVTIGLSLIGVPLALVLGVIAAVFNFVPFVGPIVSAVPAVLVAFAVGPQKALLAALVFLIAQQIESYVVVPLVQQRRVSIPPAVLLLSLVFFGLAFGVPGVILAAPLTVVALVLVRMLYVQDVLGKDVPIPGRD